jgi:hypothetical protein
MKHRCVMIRPLITLVAAMFAWTPLEAGKPKVPPDKWAIDYAKEYCVLSRDGQPAEIGIAFRTRPLSIEHDLLFYKLPGTRKEASFKGRVHRADGTAGEDRWALLERSAGRSKTVLETTITSDELAQTVTTGSVRFTGDLGIDVQAPLPNISKALDALRACEEDLAKRWGVEPKEIGTWAKPATATSDLRELFWGKDPSKYGVLQSHHVRAVLVIDESGRAVNCTIIEKSRVAWVNKHICDTLVREGQFEPARDQNGKPVRGKLVTPRITSVRLR